MSSSDEIPLCRLTEKNCARHPVRILNVSRVYLSSGIPSAYVTGGFAWHRHKYRQSMSVPFKQNGLLERFFIHTMRDVFFYTVIYNRSYEHLTQKQKSCVISTSFLDLHFQEFIFRIR